MKETQNGNVFRLFILLWMGLVYIWGLQVVQICDAGAACFRRSGLLPDIFLWNSLLAPMNVAFTLLIVLHGSLHWIMLSLKRKESFYLLYSALQGGLILSISLTKPDGYVILSLTLGLVLETIGIVQRVRLIVLALGSIALCFLLSMVLSGAWHSFVRTTDYTALFVFVAGYAGLYMQQVQVHKRDKVLHSDLEMAHVQLAVYAAQVEDLTLITERQRLARELHDTLAQGLTGVIMQMQAATSYLTDQDTTRPRQIMEQAITSARETLADARGAIDDLRSRVTGSTDLLGTVREEISHFTSTTGILCTDELALLLTLPSRFCEHVLRVIAEGLHNVARHAQASHVWVHAVKRGKDIFIEVQDDGVGFDPAITGMQGGHYGLLGLQERARLIGGHLEMVSAPGQGSLLRLRLPGSQDGEKERAEERMREEALHE